MLYNYTCILQDRIVSEKFHNTNASSQTKETFVPKGDFVSQLWGLQAAAV